MTRKPSTPHCRISWETHLWDSVLSSSPLLNSTLHLAFQQMLCEAWQAEQGPDQLGVSSRLFTCRTHMHRGFDAGGGQASSSSSSNSSKGSWPQTSGHKGSRMRTECQGLEWALKMQAGIMCNHKTRKHSNRTLAPGHGSFRNRVRTFPLPPPLKN